MRAPQYDKPQEDTFEIIWEMNKDIFIEQVSPYDGDRYYQSHMYKESIKSNEIGNAFIAMGLLWNNCWKKK